MEYISTLGRRKTSVARLYMKPGKGEFMINGKKLDKYFSSELLRLIVEQPLKLVGVASSFDFKVNLTSLIYLKTAKAIPMPTAIINSQKTVTNKTIAKINKSVIDSFLKTGIIR